MRRFKTKVLVNCDDMDERLNFLEQFTTGEPNRIVVGYSYLDATKGYHAALQEMEDRYGDPDVIINAFIKKALSWPTIKPDNPKALDDFGVFLRECENAIQSLDAIKVLEYSDNFKQIVSKLPYVMQDRWRNIVYQTKEKGDRVKFSHLVKFVQREAKKSNDPTFGKEAMTKTLRDHMAIMPEALPIVLKWQGQGRMNTISHGVRQQIHPHQNAMPSQIHALTVKVRMQ